MPSACVFEEPLDPSEGPFDGLADWWRRASSLEARAARSDVNTWYAAFPDRMGMLLGNLRSNSDISIQQAIDELYVHHLLSDSYQATYEEDASSPDFRLYRGTEYVAGVEVFTQFLDKDFASKESRNAALVAGINRRVRAINWYASIDIIDWKRQPRVTDVARWLQDKVTSLPDPAADIGREDYPTATYSAREVELAFEFFPRRKLDPSSASDGIIAIGPSILWFGQATRRLRSALSQKAGSRYDHRDRPFAVVVSVRDHSCDTYDIINALYGDDAISFRAGDPDSARSIRKGNGTFGPSKVAPRGKNRRLSCVFALMRGWSPGSTQAPTVIRFDNPFAERQFPNDILVPTFRFVARHNESDIRMEWEPTFPNQ